MKQSSRSICVIPSSLLCGVIISLLAALRVHAATLDFGDMDRGPAEQLQIGDVTVSTGLTGFGLPSTVAGLGLGEAGIGSNGSVDRIWGTPFSGQESLSLNVNGAINSFTILPHFADLANPDPIFLPFEMCYRPNSIGFYQLYDEFTSNNPVTIALTGFPNVTAVELDVTFNQDPSYWWHDYLLQHPNAQLEFGYTVESLDYTPAPEPSSLSLAVFGVTATLLCRTRKKSSIPYRPRHREGRIGWH